MTIISRKMALMLPLLFMSAFLFAGSTISSTEEKVDTNNICQALFTYESDGLVVTFNNLSFSDNGNITESIWDFGDGSDSDAENPTHEYAEDGTYEVILTITTAEGCASTVLLPLVLGDSNGCNCTMEYDPVCVNDAAGLLEFPNECEALCAGFTPNDFVACDTDSTGCQALYGYEFAQQNELEVHFEDFSYASSDIVSWYWQFGDGNSSEVQHPEHEYAEAGSYEVRLEITAADGCTSVLEELLTVSGCNCPTVYEPVCVNTPVGQIEFPNECVALCGGFSADDLVECDGDTTEVCQALFMYENDDNDSLTIHFVDLSYSFTDISVWEWDFGDGTTSTEQNPTHTYNAVGEYTVQLTIVGEDECTSTTELIVEVGVEAGCNCPSDYDPVCAIGPNGEIYSFDNFCYAECEGFGQADLVDCDGNTTNCEAAFCYELDDQNPMEVHFHNFTFAYGDGATYSWDFGDGNSSEEENPSHVYAEDGIYIVTLSIETASGCSSTFSLEVWLGDDGNCDCPSVYDPVCVVTPDGLTLEFYNACEAECIGFTDYEDCDNTQNEVCHAAFYYYQDFWTNDMTVYFEDISYSLQGITSWAWDFGDGTTSTDQHPSHTYTEAGEYTATLTIVSDSCESTFELPVYVGQFDFDCEAFFWPTADDSVGTTIYFEDLSLGNITTYQWDFGDGNTSTQQNPTHTYNAPGEYVVTLTVFGDDNCESTFEMFINTEDLYVFDYTNPAGSVTALYLPIVDLDNQTVFFNNLSESTSNITAVEYTFGDGQTSTNFNVSHTFPAAKAYNVSLKVTNAMGQVDNFSGMVDLVTGEFKATSTDGSIVLSNEDNNQLVVEATLAPNPTSEFLEVSFTGKEAGVYDLVVSSLSGQDVLAQKMTGIKGANKARIDVKSLPQGMYFLQINIQDAVKTMRFVKE